MDLAPFKCHSGTVHDYDLASNLWVSMAVADPITGCTQIGTPSGLIEAGVEHWYVTKRFEA